MKTGFKTLAVAVLAVSGWSAGAQTNTLVAAKAAPILTTNFVTAVLWFREVNGQLYNTEQSVLFKNMNANIAAVLNDSIVVNTFTMQPVYEASTTSREVDNYMGGVVGYRQVPTRVYVGDDKVSGRTIILRNYPSNLSPAVGQEISFHAIRVGTTNYNGQTLELWDYGTPHVVALVTTNYPAKTKY